MPLPGVLPTEPIGVVALKERRLVTTSGVRIALASGVADVDGAVSSSPSAPRAGRVAAGVPSTMPRRASRL